MNNLTEMLFSPLSKDYCVWFYTWSIVMYIGFLLILIFAIIYGIKNKKGIMYYLVWSVYVLAYFISYFQYRILYTMCVK